MKKILLVTLDFYPSVGGVSYYWMSLSRELNTHDFVVVAPPLPTDAKELQVNYRIIRTPFLSKWINPHWFMLLKNLWSIVRRERPNMIIVGQILPVGTVVWLLSYITNIPYIVSCHGMDIVQPQSRRKRWLMKKILARASGTIANSQYTGHALQTLGVANERISYVYPCPVNIGGQSLSQKKQNGHTLLTVGRIVQRKGHEYVIKALPEVLKKYSDTQYVIVGDGPYKQHLETLVKEMGLTNSVQFLGKLDDAETAKWYSKADVFIMTPVDLDGDVEGFGIVYLEAASWGLASIASASGGVGEAVLDDKTGIVVPPNDSTAITRVIVQLFDDPTYAQQLAQTGKNRVEKDFQWGVQAERLEQTIKRYTI